MWLVCAKTRPGLILWLLANMYYYRSIKGPTRKSRGTRFIFDGDAKLPSDFDDFLQNEDNTSFLNLFIATRAEAIYLGSEVGCVAYIMKAKTAIDCKDGEACHMHTDDNSTLEEAQADNRIYLPHRTYDQSR